MPLQSSPFLARRCAPWRRKARSANGRKELSNAARFAPVDAARRLWRTARVGELLCPAGTAWFAGGKQWMAPAAAGPLTCVHKGRQAVLLQAAVTPPTGWP